MEPLRTVIPQAVTRLAAERSPFNVSPNPETRTLRRINSYCIYRYELLFLESISLGFSMYTVSWVLFWSLTCKHPACWSIEASIVGNNSHVAIKFSGSDIRAGVWQNRPGFPSTVVCPQPHHGNKRTWGLVPTRNEVESEWTRPILLWKVFLPGQRNEPRLA